VNTPFQPKLQFGIAQYSDTDRRSELLHQGTGLQNRGRHQFSASINNPSPQTTQRVLYCPRGMAEIIVYFVQSKHEAGWQKNHRLQHQL